MKTLTREALQNGDIDRLLQRDKMQSPTMTDAQRAELVQSTINDLGENAELWVFGYGSLIWNPAMEVADQRRCSLSGYQRKFCFCTTLSRGTNQRPGLMMGLVEGDHCQGLAYKIELNKAATELDILFRREMFSFVYKPTWVEARCKDTDTSFRALTFVVDKTNERYVDNLSIAQTVKTLATAHGPLGRNCDYLFELSKKLRELELSDDEVEDLERAVQAYQQSNGK